MFGLGPSELIIIFVVIIILFGPKRLPELARSLGRSIKEFKHATQGLKEELDISQIEDAEPVRPIEEKGTAVKTEEKSETESTKKAN